MSFALDHKRFPDRALGWLGAASQSKACAQNVMLKVACCSLIRGDHGARAVGFSQCAPTTDSEAYILL